MELDRTSERLEWEILRLWHLEAMESVIENPQLVSFLRTSYVTAPRRWRELPMQELASRVEQLLNASYRLRASQLGGGDRMVPFAFYFEWVDPADTPAAPDARSDPWSFPSAAANPRLLEIAIDELDREVQAPRRGIDARCYDDAFSVFRIDEDDSWHIVRAGQRAELFRARHEHTGESPRT